MKKYLVSIAMGAMLVVTQPGLAATGNLIAQWNDVALEAIRATRMAPPVVSRALAITHTCMYDAWAAYDDKAKGTRFGSTLRRPTAERTDGNKAKAVSYAAYTCLSDLFPTEAARFNAKMAQLGFNPADMSADSGTPAGVGNVAGKAVLDFRHHDGSNQLGDLNPGAYSDYTNYAPVNTPLSVADPNHWQPLQVGENVQKFLVPHWGKVKPYAMAAGDQFRKTLLAPADYLKDPVRFERQARQVLAYTATLTDEKKAIAEYWADGPATETPPGHWTLFAEYVSERDKHTLDDDVKMFFAMTNAVFDAGIAAWDAKRYFDCVRPITAIHYLFAGQSVKSWQGMVDGADWKPYQVETFVTPPFSEYVSGHSTFSAAAAEVLSSFTKDDYFGGSATIPAGSSKVEPGAAPADDLTLYWATFTDAANEAGISRRYGGIHFVDGDLEGRKLGRAIGKLAWKKSRRLFGYKGDHHQGHDNHDHDDDKDGKDD